MCSNRTRRHLTRAAKCKIGAGTTSSHSGRGRCGHCHLQTSIPWTSVFGVPWSGRHAPHLIQVWTAWRPQWRRSGPRCLMTSWRRRVPYSSLALRPCWPQREATLNNKCLLSHYESLKVLLKSNCAIRRTGPTCTSATRTVCFAGAHCSMQRFSKVGVRNSENWQH